MQDLKDALTTLGFSPGMDPDYDVLKKKWKELCQKHHPDKPTGNADEFRRVTHAFKMLTDAEYRHSERANAAKRGNPNIHGALDIRMVIPITFEDAFFGRRVQFSYALIHFTEDMVPIPVTNGGEVDLETVSFDLPPGSTDGFQQVMSGIGHWCGEKRGNILVASQVLPHPRFQVRGGHVHAAEEIPLEVCLRGGTIEVQTMYGPKSLKVKAGTKPGDVLKVKGCGPSLAGGWGGLAKGDHYVTVNVRYPTRDELRAGTGWKGLDINWEEEAKEDLEAQGYMGIFHHISTSSTTGGFR